MIAVASGKGGVGKSTTSVNLALALARLGQRVGLLDADIYGPSQPRMLGITGKPRSPDGKKLLPMENYGVRVMSMGFLVDEDAPQSAPPITAWRAANEKRVLDHAATGGRPVLLMPGVVYGHGGGLIEQFFTAPARERHPPGRGRPAPGPAPGRRSAAGARR